jgi:hypothetical protein
MGRCAAGANARLMALLGLTLCLLCPPAHSDERFSANAVKAAYLYRMAGYVKWPRSLPANAPFTIDVLGDGPVARDLEQLLPNHPIDGHPARVKAIDRISQLGDAQMLFIGPGYWGSVHGAIVASAGHPVLVVTDERHGLEDGGTINFVEDGEHVRFEVSLVAAARAGLSISSQLLSVALRVKGAHLGSGTSCERVALVGGMDFDCPATMLASSAGGEDGTLR